MPLEVRSADLAGAALEQLLRLLLRRRFAGRVVLLGVAYVSDRELGPAVCEQAPEGERVAVVVGVVVGNDDLQ